MTHLQALQPMPEAFAAAPTLELERIDALYRTHADFVHGLIQRLGGPDLEADDLTQEVFLVAIRKWGRLPPDTDAQFLALQRGGSDRLGRPRKALAQCDSGVPTHPFGPHWFDTGSLDRRDARATIYRLVGTMSEKKRAVFLLFEIEGWSGEEIASLVRAPVKTVWTGCFHAAMNS